MNPFSVLLDVHLRQFCSPNITLGERICMGKVHRIIMTRGIAVNNLKYFREYVSIKPSELSKLLNIRTDAYLNYEKETNDIPEVIVIMLSRIYNVGRDQLFCQQGDIESNTFAKLNALKVLEQHDKHLMLIQNLVGAQCSKLSYRQINKLKNSIEKEIKEQVTSE